MSVKNFFHGPVGQVYGTVYGSIEKMVVSNGKVIINGEETVIPTDYPEITINIQGDIERLEVTSCEKIHIEGNARRVNVNRGNISVDGNIEGDAHANCGSIRCNSIKGDAKVNMGSISKL